MRPLALILACAAALLVACGPPEEERLEHPVREGLQVPLGGVNYSVFITRQLNVRDPEDRGYYPGEEAAPGRALYGVFLEACNPGDEPVRASDEFEIHDAQGDVFRPEELPEENPFAYQAGNVPPNDCIPARGSVAQQGPTSGAMLLFDLPLEATENRPLELVVKGHDGHEARIELDI